MVGFTATLVDYIVSCDGTSCSGGAVPKPALSAICLLIAAIIGKIAHRGATGSTGVATFINMVQLCVLVLFSTLCFIFRSSGVSHGLQLEDVTVLPTEAADFGSGFPNFGTNLPVTEWREGNVTTSTVTSVWAFRNLACVLLPSSAEGLLLQSAVAILILVGFDSATSLGGECKNAQRDVPRGVVLSIAVQGFFAYFLEYLAANAAVTHAGPYAVPCGSDCPRLHCVARSCTEWTRRQSPVHPSGIWQ